MKVDRFSLISNVKIKFDRLFINFKPKNVKKKLDRFIV